MLFSMFSAKTSSAEGRDLLSRLLLFLASTVLAKAELGGLELAGEDSTRLDLPAA